MAELDVSVTDTLATLPMFADLDEVGLWHVSELTTIVDVEAGHVLVQPGQEGQGLFVIVEGEVVVELPGGTKVTCGPGEFIGELSLLVDGLVHTGRVRVATPSKCLAIGRDDFARVLHTYPQIAVSMLKVLALRLAHTDEMLNAR
jgi:CRP/FNR family transcriptional regulator, cyclic AMP receptor protein